MLLNYLRPRADLTNYVRAYYYFETREGATQPLCAELGNIRIVLSGGGRTTTPGGESANISNAFLIGPTMGAYSIQCEPGTRVFGVGIRPRGWRPMLGVGASEVADRVVDLTALAGRVAGEAIDQIRNARSPQAMASAADRFFAALIDQRAKHLCAYPDALEHWLANPDDLDLDKLLALSDKSHRQLDRLAADHFGASPKKLQRKYRALRAADRIQAGALDWRDAAGLAFHDQPHFIKEFRTFVGVTPGQFIAHQASLIEAVQDRRRVQEAPMRLAGI